MIAEKNEFLPLLRSVFASLSLEEYLTAENEERFYTLYSLLVTENE